MPRNIEYFLRTRIEEENLPLFVLTCAIDHEFYPPVELLKHYGSGYGVDTFFQTHEELLKRKSGLENELKELMSSNLIDELKIENEIEGKFKKEMTIYSRHYNYYKQNLWVMNRMKTRVNNLKIKNSSQELLKQLALVQIESMITNLKKSHETILVEPKRETFENCKQRLTTERISEIKDAIKNIELRLTFDDKFYEDLKKEWFDVAIGRG